MDYFSGNFPVGGYQPTHKGITKYSQPWTPNYEISEGMRFGLNYPAPYLPLARYEANNEDYIVIGSHTPVALDSNSYMVPAGFRLLLAKKAASPASSFGPVYSSLDEQHGIVKADGNRAVAGDYVIDAMYAAGLSVGRCGGVASYDAYALAGSDPTNPATYRFHNYNRQTGVAILTKYYLEYPVEPLKRTAAIKEEEITVATSSFALDHDTVVPHSIEVRINGRKDVEWSFVDGVSYNFV